MPILQNDIDPTWQDGVNLTDTFDVWRKKTNGHIASYKSVITNDDIADYTIKSIKLSPPAPSWDETTGTVTTNGTVGGFIVKGGFTSGLASSINVSGASANPALSITSSTQSLRFNPNSTVGAWNPLVAAGDYSIIGGSSISDNKNIIIGKWSTSSHGIVISQGRVGINRVSTTNALEVAGTISATSGFIGDVTGNISGSSATFTGNLAGDVTGTQGSTMIGDSVVISKVLIGYSPLVGTITASDTILTAISKLNGNVALKANIASPIFTGTVTAPTFSGNLTGNASTATQLLTGRDINVSGDITGVAQNFNGTAAITISTSITAGAIVNADINAAAAIADTKLATISTAGKVSNTATTATNLNTAGAIVSRDASGNFSAGTITGNLTGNASTATAWQIPKDLSLTGDVTATLSSVNGSANVSAAATIANNAITTSKIANANITAAKLDGAQTGTAPIYGVRAWSRFAYGTLTLLQQAGGNLTLTRRAVGRYTANFTTPMENVNYSVAGSASMSTTDSNAAGQVIQCHSRTTTSFQFTVSDPTGNDFNDPVDGNLIVIG